MKMIRVISTAIRSIGFDPETRCLKITFQQGDTYEFWGVPSRLYVGLMCANSHGQFYNRYIRNCFSNY